MADGCVDGDQRLQLSRCQQMWRDNNDSGDGNGNGDDVQACHARHARRGLDLITPFFIDRDSPAPTNHKSRAS